MLSNRTVKDLIQLRVVVPFAKLRSHLSEDSFFVIVEEPLTRDVPILDDLTHRQGVVHHGFSLLKAGSIVSLTSTSSTV